MYEETFNLATLSMNNEALKHETWRKIKISAFISHLFIAQSRSAARDFLNEFVKLKSRAENNIKNFLSASNSLTSLCSMDYVVGIH